MVREGATGAHPHPTAACTQGVLPLPAQSCITSPSAHPALQVVLPTSFFGPVLGILLGVLELTGVVPMQAQPPTEQPSTEPGTEEAGGGPAAGGAAAGVAATGETEGGGRAGGRGPGGGAGGGAGEGGTEGTKG